MDGECDRVSSTTSGASLSAFFEARETPYALALIRIVLPCVLLMAAIPRWFFARELFAHDGAPAPLWESYGHEELLPLLPPPLAVALYTVMLCSLITLSLGWRTRTSLLVCLILYPYFGMVDSISTMTKYVAVASHVMLLLACSACGSVWSIDAVLQRGQQGPAPPPRAAVWPRRLIQIFLGVVYLGSAATKVHTPHFFTGEHLTYWLLSDLNRSNPLGEYLSLYPGAVIAGCYLSTLWEVLFLFLAWRGWWRPAMLACGAVFHVISYFTLGLLVFPLLCLTLYLAFLTEAEARAVGNWLGRTLAMRGPARRAARRPASTAPGWLSPAAFVGVLLLAALAGVRVEASIDLYGERRPQGRFALAPLPPQRAQELLRNDLRLVPQDKVFALDIGTRLFGGVLVDHKSTFRRGEQALVQCSLTPPHEDLWLELHVYDSRNMRVDRTGQLCVREALRSLFTYTIGPSMEAGEYRFVLLIDGREAASRKFAVYDER